MIGTKRINAGKLTKPILKGKSIAEYNPEIKKPDAPNTDIKKPIAAAVPMDFLIG